MKYVHRPVLFAVALASVVLPSMAHAQLGHPPSAACDSSTMPGPVQVVIYEHANYLGGCRVLGFGNYGIAGGDGQWGHFGLANDSVSSLKVGSAVVLQAFSEGGFVSESDENDTKPASMWHYSAGVKYPALPDWQNDKFSGLRVIDKNQNCQNPPAGAVAIFVRDLFSAHCAILPKGDYPDWNYMGVKNDSISSFKANGVTVQFFDHVWYGGYFWTFTNTDEAAVPANDRWSSISIR